jgi:predicted ArsR family transcriptional regulator
MNSQTRPLVELLADESTALLIATLRARPSTAPEIKSAIGASQQTIAHALELLEAHGLVSSKPEKPARIGRPSRVWSLCAEEDLLAFERACDQLKAALLRTQLAEYDDPT